MTVVLTDLVPSRVGRGAARLTSGLALAALGASLASLAACGAGAASPSAPTPAGDVVASAEAPPLTGDVAFPRTLQAMRWVEVRLDGATDDDWVVTGATLSSGLFADVRPTDENVRLFAGYTARVRVPLGDVVCPAGDEAPSVALSLRHDDGATASATVTLPDTVLAEIHADECAAKALTDVAAPVLGEAETSEGTVVHTTLTLERGASSPEAKVTLTAIGGSVIFDLAPDAGGALPVELRPGEASASVPVVLEASRCDPHAFAESKKTFVFGAWLSVDGAPERRVDLLPSPALREALQAAFDACGEAAPKDGPGGASG